MVDSGMTAVLRSLDDIGEQVVENSDTELERAWKEWKGKKTKGRVKEAFPQAQELLKERRAKGITYGCQ